MANLYELTDKYNEALSNLLDIEDLDNQTFADTMEMFEDELVEKGKNVAAYFQNLEVDVDALKGAEARIKSRRLALENKVNRLKEYLRLNMEESGITKIECPEFSVTLKKALDVAEVFDQDKVPEKYIKAKTTYTPDKVAIKKAINNGEEVPGAKISKGKRALLIK